jgi:hypothetical protein
MQGLLHLLYVVHNITIRQSTFTDHVQNRPELTNEFDGYEHGQIPLSDSDSFVTSLQACQSGAS